MTSKALFCVGEGLFLRSKLEGVNWWSDTCKHLPSSHITFVKFPSSLNQISGASTTVALLIKRPDHKHGFIVHQHMKGFYLMQKVQARCQRVVCLTCNS